MGHVLSTTLMPQACRKEILQKFCMHQVEEERSNQVAYEQLEVPFNHNN